MVNKTQHQYDMEQQARSRLKKQMVQRVLSTEEVVSQLCLMGYSVSMAKQTVHNWWEYHNNQDYIYDGREV